MGSPRLKVSAIGIGCMTMAGGNITYGDAADTTESIRVIHRAIDMSFCEAPVGLQLGRDIDVRVEHQRTEVQFARVLRDWVAAGAPACGCGGP